MKLFLTHRIITYLAIALIAMQSVMPLTGEWLAQRGWIASDSVQMICSTSGIKFIKTGEIEEKTTPHAVKCPWCQLGEPTVLPTTSLNTFATNFPNSAVLSLAAQDSQNPPWLQAPARAPPEVPAHFA